MLQQKPLVPEMQTRHIRQPQPQRGLTYFGRVANSGQARNQQPGPRPLQGTKQSRDWSKPWDLKSPKMPRRLHIGLVQEICNSKCCLWSRNRYTGVKPLARQDSSGTATAHVTDRTAWRDPRKSRHALSPSASILYRLYSTGQYAQVSALLAADHSTAGQQEGAEARHQRIIMLFTPITTRVLVQFGSFHYAAESARFLR